MLFILDGEAEFTVDGRTALIKGAAGAPGCKSAPRKRDEFADRILESDCVQNHRETSRPLDSVSFDDATLPACQSSRCFSESSSGCSTRSMSRDFHAEHQGQHATFDFDGRVRAGEIKSRTALRLIREWAAAHRSELEADWVKTKEGKPLDRIAPLE
jgi:Domain of unknown function (DUF4160)